MRASPEIRQVIPSRGGINSAASCREGRMGSLSVGLVVMVRRLSLPYHATPHRNRSRGSGTRIAPTTEEESMYARVVRFSDVTPEHADQIASEIKSGDGPPPGVPAKSVTMIYDADSSTSVVVVTFDSEQDMKTGGEALDAMDTSDTPGSRVSVDTGEVKAEMSV